MCLIIDKTKHPDLKPLIAKKDITVWKAYHSFGNGQLLTICNGCPIANILIAKYRGKKLNNFVVRNGQIDVGIHAFIEEDSAAKFFWGFSEIIKFKIPKGTPYFFGEDEEIVALKMVRAK
jgi:hypothetical protein